MLRVPASRWKIIYKGDRVVGMHARISASAPVRGHTIQLGSLGQAVGDSGGASASLSVDEQVFFPSDSHRSHRLLGYVVN